MSTSIKKSNKKIGSIIKSAILKILWILVGLVLGVALSSPITSFLINTLHVYLLDDKAPEIVNILPDIRVNKLIDKPLPKIAVRVRDKGSGLDTTQCSAEILMQDSDQPSPIKCTVSKSDSVFEIAPPDSIVTGEYTLKLSLTDRAKNNLTCSFPFVLLTEDMILIVASRRKCEDSEKSSIFSDFFEEEVNHPAFRNDDFYVLKMELYNNPRGGYLRNMYLSLDVGNLVVRCKLVGSYQMVEFEASNFLESWNKGVKGYLSEEDIRIGEIAPSGRFSMEMLIGLNKNPVCRARLANNLDINGYYMFDGYGFQVPQKLHRTIPIQF